MAIYTTPIEGRPTSPKTSEAYPSLFIYLFVVKKYLLTLLSVVLQTAAPTSITAAVTFHGLKLLFVEDESRENSHAVVAKISGRFSYIKEETASEHYALQASKLQLFVSAMHQVCFFFDLGMFSS